MEYQVLLHQLDAFAQQFWKEAAGKKVFAFHGAMGAGKTTIISMLCRYKGVTGNVSSPTFSIINEYSYVADGIPQSIYHIDLYRLESSEEIFQTGVADCIDSGAICFVEWPQKGAFLFDDATTYVVIQPISEQLRSIKILPAATYNTLSIA